MADVHNLLLQHGRHLACSGQPGPPSPILFTVPAVYKVICSWADKHQWGLSRAFRSAGQKGRRAHAHTNLSLCAESCIKTVWNRIGPMRPLRSRQVDKQDCCEFIALSCFWFINGIGPFTPGVNICLGVSANLITSEGWSMQAQTGLPDICL